MFTTRDDSGSEWSSIVTPPAAAGRPRSLAAAPGRLGTAKEGMAVTRALTPPAAAPGLQAPALQATSRR